RAAPRGALSRSRFGCARVGPFGMLPVDETKDQGASNAMDAWADELEFVKALAREAADLALGRASSVTPEEEANRSYVTGLDRDTELLVGGRLADRFPMDRLTGEEFAPTGGPGRRKWSIDPIDGTGNLVHQLPLWAISIGLIDGGEPVLGVIAVPPLNELYWA